MDARVQQAHAPAVLLRAARRETRLRSAGISRGHARPPRAWPADVVIERIAVTLLTGFLGSGKTTLLGRMLHARVHRRHALVPGRRRGRARGARRAHCARRHSVEIARVDETQPETADDLDAVLPEQVVMKILHARHAVLARGGLHDLAVR